MGNMRAIVVVSILLPALAVAQPKPTTDKEKKEAGELVKKAIAKSQAAEHEAAVELYLEAYKIIPQPLLLSNVGSEYQQMNKPVEALKYYCKYLEADPTGSNVSYATAQAIDQHKKLGNVVEAKDVCRPIPTPPPPPPPDGIGTGTVDGAAPPPPPPPPGGGEAAPKPSRTLQYAGLGVGGLGLAVFGTGIYFGLQAKKISDELTNHPVGDPWPADIKQREQEGESAENKQIGLMIGGGAAVVAGVAMFFLGAPRASSDQVAITPIATPDSLGFAIGGGF